MLAFLKDLSWTVVLALALILAVCCFLAVLWSRREWRSRKIRVGMFLEREYRNPGEEGPLSDEGDTLVEKPEEWPFRKE